MNECLRLAGGKTAVLVMALLVLGGCTPEKAKSLRLAAEQFSNQALIAVNAVEKTMQAELAPSPRSTQEQTDDFVAFLAALDLERLREAGFELGFPALEQAADPDGIDLDPAVQEARDRYLNDLRTRYTTFAGALQGLEEGALFAGEAVEGSIRIVHRLTADMAGMARHFAKHPPRLLQQRSSLVADTLGILENEGLSQASRRDRLALIKVRFDEIRTEEQELLRGVVEPSLKAAELGMSLREMAEAYDRLSVDDLQDRLLRAIRIVGDLTGRDMGYLAHRANTVFAEINADPALETVAGEVVKELNRTVSP